MGFDLEKEIAEWKKVLRTYKAFGDGDIKEYEEHLRDEIESLIDQGTKPKKAFKEAVTNFGIAKNLAVEISEVTKSPQTIKRITHSVELSILDLFPNYFKVALRNMLRNKFYSFINIVSITIGIVVSVMILQYFLYEMNYDTFYENADRIYRVNTSVYTTEGEQSYITATNFPGLSPALKEEALSVEASAYLINAGTLMRKGENVFQENNILYSEGASIFDVFSFEILEGNPKDLDLPGTVFLSDSMASRYFQNEHPMGETIEIIDVVGNWTEYEVKGIFKHLPDNSHLTADAFFHGSNVVRLQVDNGSFGNIPYDDIIWRLRNNYTYIKTTEPNNLDQLNSELTSILGRYRGSFDERQGISTRFSAQPLSEIHLTSDILNEPGQVADPNSLYFIFAIGIATLLIGWINYINLATARSLNRAREIGIRKVVGSSKLQLVIQFLFESILLNFFAVVLSIGIILYSIPIYHNMLGLDVFNYFFSFSDYWIQFAGLLVLGMLLSGLYPAIVFTKFKLLDTLKGSFKNSSKGILLRKSLIVFQFALSLFLLISIFVIYSQMQHLRMLDRGIDLENTYVFDAPSLLSGNQLSAYDVFKQDLETIPGVEKVTNSTAIPGNANFPTVRGERVGKEEVSERVRLNFARVDYEYFDHYDMKLESGRYFEEGRATDANAVLITKTASELLGFTSSEQAIGQQIFRSIGDTVLVIGVLQNYAQQSLQHAYIPIMFQLPIESGYIAGVGPTSVKITSPDISRVTTEIESTFKKHFPGDIYNGVFLEDEYEESYAAEDRFEWIFTTFTILSVLITILGLVGLSSFMIGQRTKEIGIRKVLGSSTTQIIRLITKDYFKLVFLSSIIAIPFALWWMRDWLQDFPFRMEPNFLIVGIPLLLILFITLLAVSNQSIKAALARPVHSLRTE